VLYVANADGSGEHALLPPANVRDYDASFSADGKWIVFTSERDGEGDGQADIWRVHPDGTGLERLTKDTSMEDAGCCRGWIEAGVRLDQGRCTHRQYLGDGPQVPQGPQSHR
jgi:Tol biopolymer transport system component